MSASATIEASSPMVANAVRCRALPCLHARATVLAAARMRSKGAWRDCVCLDGVLFEAIGSSLETWWIARAQRSALVMRCTLTGWLVPSSCAHSET